MELTKQDIQKIDKYLEKEIRYWDVRLEMIDHLASRLEDSNEDINIDATFLRETFGLYWKIRKEEKNRIKHINKKYKRLFFEGFIKLLKKPIHIITFAILFLTSIVLYKSTSYKMFFKVEIFILYIYLFFVFIKMLIKHKIIFNSIAFSYIINYIGFFIMVFGQIAYYLFRDSGFVALSEINRVYIFSIIFTLNLFWMYNSYQVLKDTINQMKYIN